MARNKYRKVYRKSKKYWKGKNKKTMGFIIILLIGWFLYETWENVNRILPSDTVVALSKCTDGDTAHFTINGKDETVRFLAIDTPETRKPNTPVQPYGKAASTYTCHALENAKTIRLEYEQDKKDKYERVLAWIFVDDALLQVDLVEKGLAKVKYLYDDYKYTKHLKKAETKAKEMKIGIWSHE